MKTQKIFTHKRTPAIDYATHWGGKSPSVVQINFLWRTLSHTCYWPVIGPAFMVAPIPKVIFVAFPQANKLTASLGSQFVLGALWNPFFCGTTQFPCVHRHGTTLPSSFTYTAQLKFMSAPSQSRQQQNFACLLKLIMKWINTSKVDLSSWVGKSFLGGCVVVR